MLFVSIHSYTLRSDIKSQNKATNLLSFFASVCTVGKVGKHETHSLSHKLIEFPLKREKIYKRIKKGHPQNRLLSVAALKSFRTPLAFLSAT